MKRYLALALVSSFGCDPEVPPLEDPTCWSLVSPTKPNATRCDEQRCFEKKTTVEVDSWGAAMGQFTCEACGGLRPEEISTDESLRTSQVRFGAPEGSSNVGLRVEVRFDNRAMQNPTLENLRRYALDANFSYETPQGRLGESYVPFEVVDYANGRMRVRVQTDVHAMQYQYATSGLTGCLPPGPCVVICTLADAERGGSGELVHLEADVTAPLVITPRSN